MNNQALSPSQLNALATRKSSIPEKPDELKKEETKKENIPKKDEIRLDLNINVTESDKKEVLTPSPNPVPKEVNVTPTSTNHGLPKTADIELHDKQKQEMLLGTAVIGEKDLREDCKAFAENMTKFATNKTAIFQLLLRHMEKIMKRWMDQNTSSNVFRELSEEKKKNLKQRALDADPQANLKKLYSDWIKESETLVHLIKDINQRVSARDIDTLKQKCIQLLELVSKVFDLTLQVEKNLQRDITLQAVESKDELRNKIQRLIPILKKDIYSVVTVGLEKSGKSTWTNFLVGFLLVPTSSKRCTMVITKIRNSPKGRNQNPDYIEVEVHFHDKESFEQNLKELKDQEQKNLARLREKDSIEDDEDPKVSIVEREGAIRQAYASLKEKVVKFSGELSVVKEGLDRYIANEIYVYSVKEVYIYPGSLPGDFPFELVDVPGYDTTIQRQKQMTHEQILQADAYILVYDGHKPSFNDSFTSLLQAIKQYGGLNALNKGFALVTNLDKSGNQTEGVENLEEVKKQFVTSGIPESHIIPACVAHDFYLNESQNRELTPREYDTLEKLKKNFSLFSFLDQGSAKARSGILDYVANELPLERAKDALYLAEIVRDFMEIIKDAASDIKSFENPVQQEDDTIKKSWDVLWKSAEQKGWKFIWDANSKFLDSAIATFNKDLMKVMTESEIKLQNKVAFSKSDMKVVDVEALESEARADIVYETTISMEKASLIISNEVFDMCRRLTKTMLHSLGVDESKEFKIDNIISKEKCFNAIEYQIMRFGYPASKAFLRWRRNQPNRKIAIRDLIDACPEIAPYFESSKDENKKEPVATRK